MFFLFAVIGAIALYFVITQVPETRGRSLETLEEDVETGRIVNIRTCEPPQRGAPLQKLVTPTAPDAKGQIQRPPETKDGRTW